MTMKVLCVCKGNSDRSPLMARVLQKFLHDGGQANISCESAGILDVSAQGNPASALLLKAGCLLGLDFSDHRTRWINDIPLNEFDWFVCVDEHVAAEVIARGASHAKVINANVPNPWPIHKWIEYRPTVTRILAAMFEVIDNYFVAN